MGNRDHVGIKEFKKINWLPTKERFEQCILTSIYNFFNGAGPVYLSEMYHPIGQRQITRRTFNTLKIPNQITNRGLRTISYVGPRVWNNLVSEVKSSGSVNSFNHMLKEIFFAGLQKKEDSPYIFY